MKLLINEICVMRTIHTFQHTTQHCHYFLTKHTQNAETHMEKTSNAFEVSNHQHMPCQNYG